jgi:hypothetical protein
MSQHIIVLAGLVTVEKHDLVVDLAAEFQARGESVTLIDNVARLSLDTARVPAGVTYQRLTVDLTAHMGAVLDHSRAERVIVAAAETLHPESLFAALFDIPAGRVDTVALIDTRTCDCFPNVRALLEDGADHTIYLPYTLDEILQRLT